MQKWKVQKLAYLDYLISVNKNRELTAEIYRKPTHSGLQIHFSSNQSLHVKPSISHTLARRGKSACSDEKS